MAMHTLTRHRRTDRQRGTSAVELAISLPILVVLMLIAVDFGRVMYDATTVSGSVRAGAGFGLQNIVQAADSAKVIEAARNDAASLHDLDDFETKTELRCRYQGDNSSPTTENCPIPDLVTCPVPGPSECTSPVEVFVWVEAERPFKMLTSFSWLSNFQEMDLNRSALMRVQ